MFKLIFLLFLSLCLNAMEKGYIDTHGGNSDSLIKKNSFSNNFSLGSSLQNNKIKIEKIDKIEEIGEESKNTKNKKDVKNKDLDALKIIEALINKGK